MIKQKTLFDILNDLTVNKVRWEDQTEHSKKQVQPYMLNRFLSMNSNYLDFVAECQSLTDLLTPEMYYKFYLDLLPKQKTFNKYIKGKNELDPKQRTLLIFLSQRLQMSQREAEDYFNLPNSKTMIKEYLNGIGINDKQCKSEFGI